MGFKVYERRKISVGRKKLKVWILVYAPEGTDDEKFIAALDYQKKHYDRTSKTGPQPMATSNNLLRENDHTQCPTCSHIFDHTKPEANQFEV